MPFLMRWALILIAVLLTDRVVPGMEIEHYWSLQEFFFALALSLLNTLIKPLAHIFTWHYSWFALGFLGLIVNGFVYGSLFITEDPIFGVVATNFLAVLISGAFVWLVALLCNHFVAKKA